MIHVASNGHMPFVTGLPKPKPQKIKPMYQPMPTFERLNSRNRVKETPRVREEKIPRLSDDLRMEYIAEQKKHRGLLQVLFRLRRKAALPFTNDEQNMLPCKVTPRPSSQLSPSARISMRAPQSGRSRRAHSVCTPCSHKFTILEAILEEEPDEILACSIDDTNLGKFFIENFKPSESFDFESTTFPRRRRS